jgi:hypothetical protein
MSAGEEQCERKTELGLLKNLIRWTIRNYTNCNSHGVGFGLLQCFVPQQNQNMNRNYYIKEKK